MRLRVGISVIGFLVLSILYSYGQVTTGTISGTIKDNSGAVLPSAAIEIRNVDTGTSRTTATDASGYFTAPNLPVGQYEVSASVTGFQSAVRRGISLNVGQNAAVDFTLQVGAMTEKVEVVAEAPLIETTTATVSGLVNERQVQDLPLNARDLIQLGTLYTGVSLPTTAERSASKGFGTKLSISGTRYTQSLFQLDGADINDSANSAGGAAGILMGAETVREFNVITSGFSAEYGRHTGGVFNAVTKGGTNTLHGSAFEFLRNEKLDARNFFDGRDIPPYKRNQFGGSLGGPIVRDRTFYFGSYEGLRERLGKTGTFLVPNLSVRQGIAPGSSTSSVVPAVRPYLDSYPIPNGQTFNDGTAEFIDARTFPTTENFFTVRADHKISEKDSLFGRYTFDDAENFQRSSMNAFTTNDSRNQYLAIGETRVFSPAIINQLLLGYTRTFSSQTNPPIEGMVFPTFNFTKREVALGNIAARPLGNWGGDTTFPRAATLNMFQYKDDLFYTKGSHSFKFGANVQRFRFKYGALFNGGGTYSFNSIADLLRGNVNSFAALTAQSQGGAYPQQNVIAMYAQDDYRVTSRLTVNLGLRYEFITVPAEKYGRVTNLPDFSAYNQSPANFIFGNPTFQNPSLKNFAPRLGFAWDPSGSGKTSIRAGAGIFHDQITAGPYLFGFYSSPPFVVVGTFTPKPGVTPSFPDAFFTQQAELAAQSNMEGFQYKMKQPTVYKYSFDIQREVFANTSVDIGFSSTRAVHLLRVLLTNARVAQDRNGRLFIPSNAAFRSPSFGRLRPRYSDGGSFYNALRLTVTHRFSAGLQFQSSYTFSKVLDDLSSWTGSSDWSNSPGQARYMDLKERAPSAFDLRNVWTTNFTYDLPGKNLTGAGKRVLGGWQLSGILSIQNGEPFTVSTGVSPSFFSNGFIGDYPDAVPNAKVRYDTRNARRYFDPNGAYALPPGYANSAQLGGAFIGNLGRDTLLAPGIAKLDLVVTKTTPITERLGLQFRVEAFNFMNRANFGLPSGRIFSNTSGAISGTAGRITTTSTSPRQIQFGLRLMF